jgi:excinuclease UvrABC nuclease subunit
VASRVDYWLVGSRLEAAVYAYLLARRHYPDVYRSLVKLRMPHYVKLILSNRFPRTQVTARLAGGRSLYYGPFRTRAAAERFESEFLDLFQLRRCQEDLEPSPDHPGCIYGEMNRCLRPCQQVVGVEEYASEAARVAQFLTTRGESLLRALAAARDRLSEELDFEEAARQHARWQRVQEVIRLNDELAGDIDRLNGVAVTASAHPDEILLWFMLAGAWCSPRRLSLAIEAGRPVSLDRRVRELVLELRPSRPGAAERQEHLALLARWFYASRRDGEWVSFASLDALPYRRLVNAIHRVQAGRAAPEGGEAAAGIEPAAG